MSDQHRQARRIAARVVPIARLEPARLSYQPRAQPAPVPLASPAVRKRGYGTPLTAGSRLAPSPKKTLSQTLVRTHDAAFDADAAVSGGPTGLQPADASGFGDVATADDGLAPSILWEQSPEPLPLPPQSREAASEQPPRWMVDQTVAPSEAELVKLGVQVGVILAGFADFARSAAVIENGSWQARLPMPHGVLPETALDIQVSPEQAKLRFETEHPVSREVLTRYATDLQAHVRIALNDDRPVEVTLW